MSYNKEVAEPLSLMDRIMNDYKRSDEHSLYLMNRRKFLAAGMMGAAGLTSASFQRALALPGQGLIWTPYDFEITAKKGGWGTILAGVELFATLMGFGPLFQAIKEIVKAFLPDPKEQQQAEKAQEQNKDVAKSLGFIHYEKFPEVASQVFRIFANLKARRGNSGALSGRAGIFSNHQAAAAPRQFNFPSLRDDGINGMTSHFDYDAGTYQAVGQLAGPSTSLLAMTKGSLSKYGYTDPEEINQVLYPYRQSMAAVGSGNSGLFNASYKDPDLFTNRKNTTIEVNWNNLEGGRGEGEVALHKLEDRTSRKTIQKPERLRYQLDYSLDLSQ